MLVKRLNTPSKANDRDSVMSRPKLTMLINLPTSIVEINCWGLLKKMEIIDEVRFLFFLSNSNRNLLEEINATSIPEKKARQISEIIILLM
ncbi:MAG: hypothetical protein H6Q18_941 [Bacteroidetes bacterium]|nr:hypothetical protein [Bacteroidota bacterium]